MALKSIRGILCLYPLVPCNEIRTIFICNTYVWHNTKLLELSALRRKLCDFHTVRQTVATVLIYIILHAELIVINIKC